MHNLVARLKNRVQLTTDGHKAYLSVVYDAFDLDIGYAQIVKMYGKDTRETEKKYSPDVCSGTKKNWVSGEPQEQHVSTSYIERQNFTMRIHLRPFTRLTNAFSKKIENHCYAIALHFVYYSFVKIHKTLRVTPAMEAKLTKKPMTIEDIVGLTESKF